MKINRALKTNGALLSKYQLEEHLEKLAASQSVMPYSDKKTYPIPRLMDNFKEIKNVYELLTEHLKLGIQIHPAGEWLLDNFYIIEEVVKSIEKELSIKKYKNFVGVQNGAYQGFARIYVLASEIVAYSDNKIEQQNLKQYLQAYQRKKTLSMDEIWNIGIFLQMAIIENIREICERIYVSQIQKYKVENIIERLVEQKNKSYLVFNKKIEQKRNNIFGDSMRYSFIEYMTYSLKKYGKKAYSYLQTLEEEVEKTGMTVSEVIQKEHFDVAVRKVSIGNGIISLKTITRINFLQIFEEINGVEEVLRHDPANVYEKMDHKTKEYYRNKIKEISKKTKISEIYISKKILTLAENKLGKQSHIGYYLIDEGIDELYKVLGYKVKSKKGTNTKVKNYIFGIIFISVILSILLGLFEYYLTNKISYFWLITILFFIPITEVSTQLIQYVLSKIVKPKLIPKLDFYNGIDEQNTTMVVIPTIVNSKQKVQEAMKNLEVYYLANQSKNIYFTLLGDCSQSSNEKEVQDESVIREGIKQVESLNKKYPSNFPIFHFLYRNRTWNEKEGTYLGWERKRGLLTQLNKYLLKRQTTGFRVNTIEEARKDRDFPNFKYIITLDSDTDLVLNSAFELVGSMAHILNKPILNKEQTMVVNGYGIIQPRVGVNLNISFYNLFTKIFAGAGGTDSYTNAISDIYQDNFGEGIYTGKGIYDIYVFSKVLDKAIPENKVLSHDLLEGNYLRCGLATDILLMDGYPTKYNSFMMRLSRWIRGDWQIIDWLKSSYKSGKEKLKNPLSILSKYKIVDNLRRSILEISIIIAGTYFSVKGWYGYLFSLLIIYVFPYLLSCFNDLFFRKEGEQKQKTFTPVIDGIKGNLIRAILEIGCLPYKAWVSLQAIVKTIYRMNISCKHLLEWITSEEAEKLTKSDIVSYYKLMIPNLILGILLILQFFLGYNFLSIILGIFWVLTPGVMCYISKQTKKKDIKEELNKQEQDYLWKIGEETWGFFKEYLTKENNYLIPDNYQENRNPIVIDRTSSTNIGLSILAVVSSYDLGYSSLKETIDLLEKILQTVEYLPKWNGHLYNWYQISTKEPLIPRYISTVDSGNLIGYLYVTKGFLEEVKQEIEEKEKIEQIIQNITNIIQNTDFSVLFNKEQSLFSIGFNIEENKLTDSYYDLLASEARQASLIAISKKDIPVKHWNNLSRTLTTLNKYKGLISWAGTAFEYLMPNVNIPKYPGSLLDESCKFLIMSQQEYSKKLGLPWGISEAAFNLKDLHSNYQYKAFGVPWLGLKRGLSDEMVVASYGSVLAVCDMPKKVVENLKELEKQGMRNKYGFYESIDYTPARLNRGQTSEVVKTYMAHHQGLILLSINNVLKNQILQKRFMINPEIRAVDILLQERMPKTFITTKEKKERPEKLKYRDYESYIERVYTKIDERLIRGNVISNEQYMIALDQKGRGFSKYHDIYVNRFKRTNDIDQGFFFYFKNIKTKKIWSSNYRKDMATPDQYRISFMPDRNKIERIDGNIKTDISVTIDPNEPVEIRRITLHNMGNSEEIIEVSSCFEPVLSKKEQDYAHPAFNNLFLVINQEPKTGALMVKRKKRAKTDNEYFLLAGMIPEQETMGETEFEIDKEKFFGRGNFGIPKMVKQSIPFSKKIGYVTEPIIALKRTIKIPPQEKVMLDLVVSVNGNKEKAIENWEKYKNTETVKRTFALSKAKVEEESRYLQIKGKDIENYQKILSYLIFDNPLKAMQMKKVPLKNYEQSKLWKYGISGEFPIILVCIKDVNDMDVVRQALKAYEYMKMKNIQIELVILNEEKHSYENYVKDEIDLTILNYHMAYLKNIRGGIFVLSKSEMNMQDVELLKFVSSVVLDSSLGNLDVILKDREDEYLDSVKEIGDEKTSDIFFEENANSSILIEQKQELKYNNEYGGFLQDGKEYHMVVSKENRLPTVWTHIMANPKVGTVVTENMGGYSWYKNSRLNRISSWNNYASLDIPSEVIYMKDVDTQKIWSLGCSPTPDDEKYSICYGYGYAGYRHISDGIIQDVTTFVAKEDPVKIQLVTLKNTTPNKRKFKIYYYVKPVLGEDEIKTHKYLKTKLEKNSNILITKIYYQEEFNREVIFLSSSEKIQSYTGNKSSFFGGGGINAPEGLKKIRLSEESGLGKEACMVAEIDVELESFAEKELTLILGAEEQDIEAKNLAYKYSKISNCHIEENKVKQGWNELLGKIQVQTPIESCNLILNGWAIYQTVASRLVGKSGFYQSGGAIGFRDQLQDAIGLKYLDSDVLKNQIIKSSSHQFIEGDVLHWWHEETERGIRTRFSDDRLWLVYAVIQYIETTGDFSVLDIQTPYLRGEVLKENEDEKYDKYLISDKIESIYEHCQKAIEISLNFGKNGLPKIGSGDWNDGFSEVGNKGKGESIWLGFFLYHILEHWIPICEKRQDNKVENYINIKEKLRKSLNTNGWDGRWYKRAYMDDGSILGSIENEECRIDSIAQSWSVISGAGDNDKKYISMDSLENHLVDKENGIIKLLDPPFENGKLEPGYIKAYLPGVRENGGQYTHAAIWVIIAEAILGFGDKAFEFYKMINPIEHSRTKEAANKYKVEPYSIPADIYGAGNLIGRGGWTWYTGSSSWYYQAGIEYILGLKIKNKAITISPCIPKDWKEYKIQYKYKNSIYHIKVNNPNGKNTGIEKITLNGKETENKIILDGSGQIYNIEVIM